MTVTLRSRVNGELLRFAVHEGQMVSDGDRIAEIDPRPFEVQLLQAQGQKERDQVILENAHGHATWPCIDTVAESRPISRF
jgi:multidrug efflux system membrane fusion protein